MYEGNLNLEKLIDWISVMDKYFDYENVDEDKKVEFAVTRLKGHATLWWDNVKVVRRNKGKRRITSWDRMVAKLKGKFLPQDYQLNIFQHMQNIKKKSMFLKEYTEEFYRLSIRFGHVEANDEKLARYINGIIFEIQDELGILSLKNVEEAYQIALKIEEKLVRKKRHR